MRECVLCWRGVREYTDTKLHPIATHYHTLQHMGKPRCLTHCNTATNCNIHVHVCCSAVQCVVLCCSVLQYVAAWCSVLQGVAGCCRVLQCTLQHTAPRRRQHAKRGRVDVHHNQNTATLCYTLQDTLQHTLQHTPLLGHNQMTPFSSAATI